ncbi:MAG: T9SS type A sorting domain-containing protein [Candidatus Kapaibacteriota bacterium]
MKKFMFLGLAVLVLSLYAQVQTYAQGRGWNKNFQGRGANCQFVDLNGDGICDNFVDANNDGICDNCRGFGKGGMKGIGGNFQGQGKGLRQRNFVDSNGDGICDNYQNRAIVSHPYPQPFSSSTNFDVTLQTSGNVTITLNDLEGKIVKTIFSGKLDKGTHNFILDSKNLTPGRYFIVIKVNDRTYTRPVYYRP